jgi:heat shock protein HtpX
MNSYFKTAMLLSALTALFIAIGYVVGGSGGLIFMLIFSILINFISFFFSDKIALSISGAKQIDRQQYPELFSMADDLSQKMDIPLPKLYVSDQLQPNAFATGRNPKNSAVNFTKGLLNSLSYDEVKGVMAHEFAHIKNRDVLVATVAAIIAGAISAVTDFLMYSAIFGGSDNNNRNPFVSILLIITAPIAAVILQFAISRSREYLADETAAKYTNAPKSLANALVKIEAIAQRSPMHVNPAMASLYIQNPFALKGIAELFSTHPPTHKRVDRLLKL